MHDDNKIDLISFFLMIAGLILVLWLGLLPALLGGLLVYFVVESGAMRLQKAGLMHGPARMVLLILIALIVLALLISGVFSAIGFASHGHESLAHLLRRMADIISAARNYLPEMVQDFLPADVDEWQRAVSEWLRDNAGYVSGIGRNTGLLLLRIFIGMIVGGLIAVSPVDVTHGPFARALKQRVECLGLAFKRVVFSQFKISALNTFLTGIFLAVVLPLSGNPLPFVKTMIVVTFVVGLLPVIGNLISNTVIFLIALSVSPMAAVTALAFLIIIHKLEYFVNAKIVGHQIKARAWEILLAMLFMETMFGLSGLVAAPIYYAYLKDELKARKLV